VANVGRSIFVRVFLARFQDNTHWDDNGTCDVDLIFANSLHTFIPVVILTVTMTGLVLALPMAKYLQVPIVYARKECNVVMANTYVAGYSSKMVGKNRELLVSKSHLHQDDRILIVDDFL
jgi:adenine/guanine phosphoribosyltransferase-like PRPP-binding protein